MLSKAIFSKRRGLHRNLSKMNLNARVHKLVKKRNLHLTKYMELDREIDRLNEEIVRKNLTRDLKIKRVQE